MPDAPRLSVPAKLAEICRPSRTALLVYDMQVGVASQIEEGRSVAARCKALLTAARKGGFPVYFARHRWLPNRLAGIGQLRRDHMASHRRSMECLSALFAGFGGMADSPRIGAPRRRMRDR